MAIGTAVVGTGRWGKQHVRILAESKRGPLRWVCDKDAGALAKQERQVGAARTTADLDEVLRDPEVQAVIVTVPSPAHFAVAKRVLEAGRHCFVEKPLTLKAKESEQLVSLAHERGRVLMVGHLLLYHPAYRHVAKLVESGDLGDVYYLICRRTNLGVVRPDENAWWSLAPHDISVALDLFHGLPESISASGGMWIQQGIEDTVFAVLRWSNGRMAQIHVSWLDPHKKRELTIVGSKKMVVWEDTNAQEPVRIYDKGVDRKTDYQTFAEFISLRSGDVHLPAISMQEPLALELDHFLDAIEKGTKPRSDGQNGLDVVRVLEAGQRSLEKNGAPERI
jgi:predicted dehydrogenase